MSDEIKVQSKNKKTKFIIAVAAVVIAVLTIVAIVLVSSGGATAKKAKEQLSLGDKYLSELQYEQAIAAYELAIEIDPKCEDAYIGLAEIYIATGQVDKAKDILDKAEEALGKETEGIKNLRDVLGTDSEDGEEPEVSESGESVKYRTEGDTFYIYGTGVLERECLPMNVLEGVTKIVIEAGITEIGNSVFHSESSLKEVTLPESLERIGDYAFCGCDSLYRLEIPGSVKEIGKSAFAYCNKLVSVTFSEGVRVIGDDAFNGCSKLSEITFSSTLEEIGDNAFSSTAWIKNNVSAKEMVIVSGVLLRGINEETVVIPEGVRVVEDYAFENCSKVKSIEFPKSVKKMSMNAFYGTAYYTELFDEFHQSDRDFLIINNILMEASLDLRGSVSIPEGVIGISEAAFSTTHKKILEITLPKSLEYIDDGAFYECDGITKITIPGNVKELGRGAFGFCDNLREVVLEEGIETMDGAFQYCEKLTEVTIPGSVTEIGDHSFSTCDSLLTVTIEEGVERIGDGVFQMCAKLEQIRIPESVKDIAENAFSLTKDFTIITPAGSYAESYAIRKGFLLKNE